MMETPTTWLFCMTFLLATAVGCADPDREKRGEVSGTVLLDGEPAMGGTIRFVSLAEKSGPSSGGPIVNGQYHIGYKLGPALGENQVQFSGTMPTGNRIMFDGREIDETVEVFPAKFQWASPEKCTIKPGKNEVNFDLKSK